MGFIGETILATDTDPIAATMATRPINLISFARLAGKNMLAVIPTETKTALYLRGPANIHWVMDPEMITEILVGSGRGFPKSKFTKDIIGSAVGNGLILSEGEKWKAQRRRYAPLFAARNLPMLTAHFALTGAEMARLMLDTGGTADVARMSKEATLANISRVMFAGSASVDPAEVRDGLKRYFDFIADISLFDLMGLPKWIPRMKWFKSLDPVTSMRALARRVIDSRRAEKRAEPQDFLDLMIAALDEDFEDIETTVDNLLTFVVAGHETSSNTLAWGLYLLAMYPDVQDDLRREVIDACDGGTVTYDSLDRMPRLLAHVRETLRLYPAAAFFGRDAGEDTVIKGVTFKKGDAIFVPVYALHRHAALWNRPESYLADRFLGERPKRGQYIPFGDGPRVCIGAQYAETEITVLMASVLRQVAVSIGDAPVPQPVLTFTMRPEGPLLLGVDPAAP